MDIQYTLIQLVQLRSLKQVEIAKGLGCSQSYLSELKSGTHGGKRPSYALVSKLKKLAKKHGVRTVQPGDSSTT